MSPQERFRESCESRGTSVYILMTLHSGRPTLEFKLSTLNMYIIINKERVYFPRHHLEPRNTNNSIPVQRLQTQKDEAERKNKEKITIVAIPDRSLVCQI